MRRLLLASLASTALLMACGEKPAPVAEAPKAALGAFGVDLSYRDATIKPGDDFFRFANNKWLQTFQLPADKARFGSFDELADKSEKDVRSIVDGLAASPGAAGTTAAKVGDLYASWMDEAGLEARGLEPLKPYLAQIEAAKTKDDIVKLMSTLDFAAPFGLGIEADPDDPTRYSVWAVQGGLGMPDRDYYLTKSAKFDEYRAAYKAYVTKVFELLGDKAAAKSADTVMALETKIANAHWKQQDLRDVAKAFNTMTFAEFKAFAPAVKWDGVFAGIGFPADVDKIVAYGDTAVRDGAKLINSEPVAAWKTYLTFHIASDNATNLTKAFDEAQFEFFGKKLRGVTAQRERWKRGVALLDGNIGEGLGQVYVEKFFPADNKAKMDALVGNLRTALEGRLKTLAWMDEPTRAEALKKLGTFEPRIGYPVKWRDYSALNIAKGKHFENMAASRKFDFDRRVARLKQPVDRTEWDMNASTVNANYNPLMNQITFPAGILQPPFFDGAADPAVNYGAIGAVIGHEIGHGFDDQGRMFDEKGVTRNWWTPETDAKFKAATDTLAAQYDKYCPVTDGCLNGRLTMGENIGDLGGLTMAYTAYHLSLGGKEDKVIEVDGVKYTGDQRFFLAWAQVWRAMGREDDTRARIVTDPHSPPEFRVNGVVRNLDEWYAAFDVKEGDKLYLAPDQRVKIW